MSLKDDAGVLLSTHQLNEVEQVCDRVQLLKEGATILSKNIDELKRANKIRMRFETTAPLNELKKFQQIVEIEQVNENTIDIYASGDLDVLKNNLLAQSQSEHWGLLEIHDVRETLEDIFVTQVLHTKH